MTPEEALKFYENQKQAYQLTFNEPHGKIVLDDFAPFCRARETCAVPGNMDKTLLLEGRREVWLRIRDFLDLTPEQLVAKYTKPLERRQGDERHDHDDD